MHSIGYSRKDLDAAEEEQQQSRAFSTEKDPPRSGTSSVEKVGGMLRSKPISKLNQAVVLDNAAGRLGPSSPLQRDKPTMQGNFLADPVASGQGEADGPPSVRPAVWLGIGDHAMHGPNEGLIPSAALSETGIVCNASPADSGKGVAFDRDSIASNSSRVERLVSLASQESNGFGICTSGEITVPDSFIALISEPTVSHAEAKRLHNMQLFPREGRKGPSQALQQSVEDKPIAQGTLVAAEAASGQVAAGRNGSAALEARFEDGGLIVPRIQAPDVSGHSIMGDTFPADPTACAAHDQDIAVPKASTMEWLDSSASQRSKAPVLSCSCEVRSPDPPAVGLNGPDVFAQPAKRPVRTRVRKGSSVGEPAPTTKLGIAVAPMVHSQESLPAGNAKASWASIAAVTKLSPPLVGSTVKCVGRGDAIDWPRLERPSQCSQPSRLPLPTSASGKPRLRAATRVVAGEHGNPQPR
jgi:hypothetical protein